MSITSCGQQQGVHCDASIITNLAFQPLPATVLPAVEIQGDSRAGCSLQPCLKPMRLLCWLHGTCGSSKSRCSLALGEADNDACCVSQGEQPHCGFPEKNYHQNAERLARAGLKVVVVEQTETPAQLSIRNEERKANKQNQVTLPADSQGPADQHWFQALHLESNCASRCPHEANVRVVCIEYMAPYGCLGTLLSPRKLA